MIETIYAPEQLLTGTLLDPVFAKERREIATGCGLMNHWDKRQWPDECIDGVIRQLDKMSGVIVAQPTRYHEDFGYRCAEAAFGSMGHGETWAMRGFTVNETEALWREPVAFLTGQGYELVSSPCPGDVITYGGIREWGERRPPELEDDWEKPMQAGIWFEHFGVLTDDLRYVASKFGRGPFVVHLRDLVSQEWGYRYWIWRKQPEREGIVSSSVPPLLAIGNVALYADNRSSR
ncbi:MAG TPA: hypothetical protein VMY99_02320 [Nevskiaceae bacterium]|nr:hypothetical protein [Nevskiaceae bacterium]